MDSQNVRRRVNMIAAHLAAHDDISPAATHLFPMSCSSSLNSAIPRYDNRMYYARQSSNSQACFMRLTSNEQGSCTESALPFKPNDCAKKTSTASEGPMFSKPANKNFHFTAQGCKYNETAAEAPKFARPRTRTNEALHFQLKERRDGLEFNGSEWSPRMDVAESGGMYVVSIELPGVNISDIKVEVSDKSLIVSGNRSTQCKVASYLNDLISAYHKKEIVQGPYRVFWPLPSNANKDRVSAEFVSRIELSLAKVNLLQLTKTTLQTTTAAMMPQQSGRPVMLHTFILWTKTPSLSLIFDIGLNHDKGRLTFATHKKDTSSLAKATRRQSFNSN